MKAKLLFTTTLLNFWLLTINAQIVDIHNHITNKHFVNDVEQADSISFYLKRDGKLPEKYLTNWIQKIEPIDHTEDSNYGNYFQSSYTDLEKGNYSFVIQSISPLEPNIFYDPNSLFRNFVRSQALSTMGIEDKDRFTALISTPSWNEAYNEFLYTVNQNKLSPDGKFHMIFPKDAADLAHHKDDKNTCIGIISFEGGHILFGKTVFDEKGFMNASLSPVAKDEVRANINFLTNKCDYRTFFITPVHIYWNTLGGQAKAADKLEARWKLKFLSQMEWFRKKLFTKYGAGIPPRQDYNGDTENPGMDSCRCSTGMVRVDNGCYEKTQVDSFGKEVISLLLNPLNKWHKPIYIDVKHMDVRSRIDYYLIHDELEKTYHIKIPIIYSHGAASGKSLKVAYFTSVAPQMDRYEEVIDPIDFDNTWFKYNLQTNCGLFQDYAGNPNAKEWFSGIGMTDPKITLIDAKLTNSLSDTTTNGWFYPWSINLFDEEIKKIYDSDGIIGIMAEERTLGWYLPNYQDPGYSSWLRDTLISKGFFKRDVDTIAVDSFRVAECFLRNVFYTVQHSGRSDISAWEHVGFGSDFDGFINPIDICQTSADVPNFKKYLIKAIPYFLAIHREYWVNGSVNGILYGLTPERVMNMLFYENSKRLILTYF
jgi:hypothetical protein